MAARPDTLTFRTACPRGQSPASELRASRRASGHRASGRRASGRRAVCRPDHPRDGPSPAGAGVGFCEQTHGTLLFELRPLRSWQLPLQWKFQLPRAGKIWKATPARKPRRTLDRLRHPGPHKSLASKVATFPRNLPQEQSSPE